MKTLLLLAAAALLVGCTALDRYDRTYSVRYQDRTGTELSAGVTLRPRDGLAK